MEDDIKHNQSTRDNLAKTQYKNGMDDHDKFVDSLVKQGAKFRMTMKHGFPVTARKTMTDTDFP